MPSGEVRGKVPPAPLSGPISPCASIESIGIDWGRRRGGWGHAPPSPPKALAHRRVSFVYSVPTVVSGVRICRCCVFGTRVIFFRLFVFPDRIFLYCGCVFRNSVYFGTVVFGTSTSCVHKCLLRVWELRLFWSLLFLTRHAE